jgi:DNA-binding CsgD family transcriptional regulator
MLAAATEKGMAGRLVEDLRATFEADAGWAARVTPEGNPPTVQEIAADPPVPEYFERFTEPDPLLRRLLLELPEASGGAVALSAAADGARWRTLGGGSLSAFMREAGWGDVMEGVTVIGGGLRYVVGIARREGQLAFGPADREVLLLKLRDARVPLELLHLTGLSSALKSALDEACADAESAIFLLDEAGRPVQARGNVALLCPNGTDPLKSSSTPSAIRLLPPALLGALKRGVRRCQACREDPRAHSELLTVEHLAVDLSVVEMSASCPTPAIRFYAIVRPHSRDAADHLDRLAQDAALSEREKEIVLCAASGLDPDDIARALGISLWTVRTHLRNIYAKAGVRNRAALVCKALGR